MLYILILLLIPIFFVGMVIYISTIFDFMFTGNLDTVLLLIGIFGSSISGFIIMKEFSLIEFKNAKVLMIQRTIDSIIGLFSFTLLLLFGVSLIVNSLNTPINLIKLLVGVFIVLFYLYVVYFYVLNKKVYVCKLVDISKINDNLYLIMFDNKDLGIKDIYVKDKKGLKKDKSYKVFYSNSCKCITKIINEVIEV